MAFQDYESLEEQFRHLIVLSVNKEGLPPTIPVFENYDTAPALKTDYAVAYVMSTLPHSLPVTASETLNPDYVEHNVRQKVAITFTVQFVGKRSRDLAHQSRLWLASKEGIYAQRDKRLPIQSISPVLPIFQAISGGKVKIWEKRSKFDVQLLVLLEQKKEHRQASGIIKSVQVRTNNIDEQANTLTVTP